VFGEMIYARRQYQVALEERARLAESERDEARAVSGTRRARAHRSGSSMMCGHTQLSWSWSRRVLLRGARDSPEQPRESLVRIQGRDARHCRGSATHQSG